MRNQISKKTATVLSRAATPALELLENRRLMVASNPNVVDIYMGYSAAARAQAGSQAAMVDLINRSIANTNVAMANSKARVTLRLVGTTEVNYTESNDGNTEISRLLNPSDGQLDDVSNAAAAAGADVTAMVVTNLVGLGGITSFNSMVLAGNSLGTNILPHEIGHVFGAGHTHFSTDPSNTTAYSFEGVLNFNGTQLGGAMAGSLPFYSNPNLQFRGKPTGVAGTGADAADNTRRINETAAGVAGTRASVIADTTGPTAQLNTRATLTGQNGIRFVVRYGDDGGVNVDSIGNDDIRVTGPNGFTANATLLSVSDSSTNYGVQTAVYQVNTPGAVGDLNAYSFSINAGSVTDISGNAVPTGAVTSASSPRLPDYGGGAMYLSSEEGDMTGRSAIFAGDVGGKYQNGFAKPSFLHFNVTSDQTLTLTSDNPGVWVPSVFQDADGNVQWTPSEQVAPTGPGTFSLKAGQDYYIMVNTQDRSFGTYKLSATFAGPATAPPPPADVAPASLQGSVFIDTNKNGFPGADETRSPNITVRLTGTNDLGQAVNVTAITDSNGNFFFTNLRPSNAAGYTVTRIRPAGASAGLLIQGSRGGTPVEPDTITGIRIEAGNAANSYLFGMFPSPAAAAVGGSVYIDANNDGQRQDTEAGIANVAVTISGTDFAGNAVNTTLNTDASGNYTFANVAAANASGYTLSIVQPANVLVGKNTVGTVGGQLNATLPNQILAIPLNGVAGTGYLFGQQPLPASPPPPPDTTTGITTTSQNNTTGGNVNNPTQIAPVFDYSGGFASAAGNIATNGSATINGAVLRLTNAGGQAASAYYNQKVNVTKFNTQFNITSSLGDATADGMTFIIQGNDTSAMGTGGGALGSWQINKSVAIKFDLWDNAGEGTSSTGIYLNGALPMNVGSIDLRPDGINLHNGNTLQVNMAYDGSVLSVTISDPTTGAVSRQAYLVDIAGTVGGSTAFVGFTAGTGGFGSNQTVGGWTYAAPAAVAAPAVAALLSPSAKLLAPQAAVALDFYTILIPGQGPQHAASFTLNRDGTYQYTPARNFYGTDSFSYLRVDANGRTSVSTMNIIVTRVLQPTMEGEGVPHVTPAVAGQTVDIDMTSQLSDLQGRAFKIKVTKVTGGTAKVLSDGHTIRFTPAKGFIGNATVRYICDNGLACSHMDVTICVNPAVLTPVANKDSATTLPSTAVSIDALKNDADPAGVHLCLSSVDDPAHGTATIDKRGSKNPADWRIVYRPDFGFHGTETFNYTMVDFLGSPAKGKITVTVTPGAGIGVDPTDSRKTALDIFGTSGNDKIDVWATGNDVGVKMNGKVLGTFKPTGLIGVFGGAGNDGINANFIPRSTWLFGEDGNDTIAGGSAGDLIVGGRGTDMLIGRSSADRIITGTADYAAKGFAPLKQLFSTGTTVAGYLRDDAVADTVYGGKGVDQFWGNVSGAGVKDLFADKEAGETISDLA